MGTGADGHSHRFFEDMAVTHVLGGLDESDGRVFRSHLLECADCRARVGELRAIAHELADVERDERRLRAAKAIETKRRESDDDDPEDAEPGRSQRTSRIIAIVGFALVVLLAAWNFTLRGTVARQEGAIADLQLASEVLQLGEEATVRTTMEGVDAEVRTRDGHLVLLIDGLDQDRLYGVYGVREDETPETPETPETTDTADANETAEAAEDDEDVTFSRGWPPTDEKLHVLIRNPGDAERVIVTEYSGQLPTEPSGKRVLTASLPTSG